jgi:hypothetical protein
MPRKKEGLDIDASPRRIARWPARGASTSAGSHQQDVTEDFDACPLRTSKRWPVNLPGYLYGEGLSVAALGFPRASTVATSP